jgi:hypothetical protein
MVMVVVVVAAAVVVVGSIRCGFKIVQRQVNEAIIIIVVVIFFLLLLLLLMMMIHEVHVVVVVILQIIIRTGVIHTASSIVGVGVDDFYHSICYIHEAKSRPDFLSFEVCMFYGEVLSASSSS